MTLDLDRSCLSEDELKLLRVFDAMATHDSDCDGVRAFRADDGEMDCFCGAYLCRKKFLSPLLKRLIMRQLSTRGDLP